MHTVKRLISIARPYLGKLIVVAALTSMGALAELVEPLVYRAIINDIAGVFVSRETGLFPEILEELRSGRTEPETTTPREPAPTEPATAAHEPATSGQSTAEQTKPRVATARERGSRRVRKAPQKARSTPEAPRPLPAVLSKSLPLPPRTVSHAIRTLWVGVLVLLGAAGLAKLFAAWGELLAARTTNEIEENFILKTFKHVLRLPFRFFTQQPSGAIARQIDQSDQIAPLYSAVTREIWSELFMAVAILIVMMSVNLQLSLVVLVALLVYLLVSIHMTRRLETHLEEYYGLWDEVSGRIQEAVSGIKTVRLHANESYETERTAGIVRNAFQTYLARKQVETRYTLAQNTLINVSKALVLGLGGMKALEHQLTPGDVVMFVAYLDRIYSPVYNLTALYSVIQRHLVSLHRAFRLLDVEEEKGQGREPLRISEGQVEFRDVDFEYRKDRPVLSGASFSLRPGEVSALIGPSGAGKTTIADLMFQLYTPLSGMISVDGQDLSNVDPSVLRKQLAVVSADGTIFRDTLGQNIRYGRLDASEDEVRRAALEAGLGPTLERLPEGLSTMLGERGYELSLGERQRVLLARAFLANPRVLILDEATANLDFKTEAAVKKTLSELTHGRTTLIIAHRQSMLTDVDWVIAIRDGHVIEQGPPPQLLSQHGYFFQMMTAQGRTPELRVQ